MANKVLTVAREKVTILFRSAKDGGLIIDPLRSRVNKCPSIFFAIAGLSDSTNDCKNAGRRCLPQVLHQKKVRKVADVAENIVLFVGGDTGTSHPRNSGNVRGVDGFPFGSFAVSYVQQPDRARSLVTLTDK